MFGVSGKWARDAGERVGFTGVEAVAAVAIVELASLQTWWAAPLTAVFAGVKAYAAKHKGSPDTAAFRKSSEAGGS